MTPWVRNLIVANLGVFFLTQSSRALHSSLALFVEFPGVLMRPWTPLTYMFVHADFAHLFGNMLILFFLGPRVESRLGSRRFATSYVVAGLGGAALSFVFARNTAMIGASGAVYGVVLTYAMFWPRENLWLFGVLPLQPRAIAGFMFILALLNGFDGLEDGIAHFAHLGGFLGAFVYARWIALTSPAREFKDRVYGHDRRRFGQDSQDVERWQQIRLEDLHEVNRVEVERLQAKIKDQGVGSLTIDERAFLNRFARQPL